MRRPTGASVQPCVQSLSPAFPRARGLTLARPRTLPPASSQSPTPFCRPSPLPPTLSALALFRTAVGDRMQQALACPCVAATLPPKTTCPRQMPNRSKTWMHSPPPHHTTRKERGGPHTAGAGVPLRGRAQGGTVRAVVCAGFRLFCPQPVGRQGRCRSAMPITTGDSALVCAAWARAPGLSLCPGGGGSSIAHCMPYPHSPTPTSQRPTSPLARATACSLQQTHPARIPQTYPPPHPIPRTEMITVMGWQSQNRA